MKVTKRCTILFLCFALVFVLIGCNKSSYDTEWIIGKTSSDIVIKYGTFDCVTADESADGLYKNCKCGYTVTEAEQGLLGRTEEVLLFIYFDESGKATKCEEGYRPGG